MVLPEQVAIPLRDNYLRNISKILLCLSSDRIVWMLAQQFLLNAVSFRSDRGTKIESSLVEGNYSPSPSTFAGSTSSRCKSCIHIVELFCRIPWLASTGASRRSSPQIDIDRETLKNTSAGTTIMELEGKFWRNLGVFNFAKWKIRPKGWRWFGVGLPVSLILLFFSTHLERLQRWPPYYPRRMVFP